MKKILLISCFFIATIARADIQTDTAVLRTMDKITGRVQKITVGIGEQIKVGSLTVLVEKCLKKPPEEIPENSAFLTITDEDTPEKPVFYGWMFSSNPALSAMEHPVYDIWVVECGKSFESKGTSDISQKLEEENPAEFNEPIED